MRSIKPGRGPSMMSGVMGIFVAVFGVIWTVVALNMGGGIFALFGVVFIIMAVVMTVYNFKNATGENRYSTFDITDDGEEIDPLNERFGRKRENGGAGNTTADKSGGSAFCPYCGAKVEGDFEFCNKCGKKLP